MQITNEELENLFKLFREMQTTRVDRYEHDVYDQIRKENNEYFSMVHFIKTHYPEALEAWHAVNKIGE